MPQILTTKATITCPHGGRGTTVPSNPKWKINGGFVLLENDTGTLACPFILYPCSGYQLRSMGLNATQIDGRKVVLSTDFNQTFTGLPLLMVEIHTTVDNSTPAPIPAGQAAPPLSPPLADMTAPSVTPAPAALGFNTATMMPATLSATFTLVSAHPQKWILMLLNVPSGISTDVTNGLPPGLVVTPAGGGWNSSPLTVVLTMTAAYMATLPVGEHQFYMTGVSQRGLSHFAEIVLTVS